MEEELEHTFALEIAVNFHFILQNIHPIKGRNGYRYMKELLWKGIIKIEWTKKGRKKERKKEN